MMAGTDCTTEEAMLDETTTTEDWVLSRKLIAKSFARHFTPWKRRCFVLSQQHHELRIYNGATGGDGRLKSSGGGDAVDSDKLDHLHNRSNAATVIHFSNPTIRFHHYHQTSDGLLLSIQYCDLASSCEKEVSMKFDRADDCGRWLEALQRTLLSSRKELTRDVNDYLVCLVEHVRELRSLQGIVDSEPQYEALYYGASADLQYPLDDGDGLKEEVCDQAGPDHHRLQIPNFNGFDINEGKGGFETRTSFDDALSASKLLSLRSKTMVPAMQILITAIGTRGDVQPFVQLGLRLRRDGHRVRLATHSCFEDYVRDVGLDFYPLAGDPLKLSEFMVKTQGCLIPTTKEQILDVPAHHAMMVEMINSCWGACVDPDPSSCYPERSLSSSSNPFRADCLISNPITYAHFHCAEALSIPLHLMFPQPWVPTKSFPHPLSCLSFRNSWCKENYLSYQIVDRLMWLGFEREINLFRKNVLGLEPLRIGQSGHDMLNLLKVPFVKMWSPLLVPKPKDWPAHVDVVGFFFGPVETAMIDHSGMPCDGTITGEGDTSPTTPALFPSLNGSINNIAIHGERSRSPISPSMEFDFLPPPDLLRFLYGHRGGPKRGSCCVSDDAVHSYLDRPPIFVGFGSMVIKSLESVVSLFLEAAALIQVRIIVQMGWTDLSSERFSYLAREAQRKADLIRQVVALDDIDSWPTACNAAMQEEPLKPPDRSSTSNVLTHTHWLFDIFRGGNSGASKKNDVDREQLCSDGREGDPVGSGSSAGVPDAPAALIDHWSADRDSFFIGPCPHNWLFQHVSAVVHHGGAGTTAAGLRFGCPTWICPFFGDQFFWGEMVHRNLLGPKPCSIPSLSLSIVSESLEALLGDKGFLANSVSMRRALLFEDGVEGACRALYKHLPLENMLCEVSIFMGQYRLAKVFCPLCGFRMCVEVSNRLHNDPSLHLQEHLDKLVPCSFKDWSRVADPSSLADGLVQGLGALVHELSEGVTDALYDPIRGAYSHGLVGGAAGLSSGLQSLLKKPLSGGSVFMHKVRRGVAATMRDDLQQHHHHFNTDSSVFNDEPLVGLDSGSSGSFSSPIVRTPSLPATRGLPHYLESSAITQLEEEEEESCSSLEDNDALDQVVGEKQDGYALDDCSPFAFLGSSSSAVFFDDERDIESVYHSMYHSIYPPSKEEEPTAPFTLHTEQLPQESSSVGGDSLPPSSPVERSSPTSLGDAYRRAVQARELFTALGAVEGRFLSLKAFGAVVHRSLQRRCVTTSLPGEAGGDLSTPEVTVDGHVLLSLLKLLSRRSGSKQAGIDLLDFSLFHNAFIAVTGHSQLESRRVDA